MRSRNTRQCFNSFICIIINIGRKKGRKSKSMKLNDTSELFPVNETRMTDK